jgi:hypothetical protein
VHNIWSFDCNIKIYKLLSSSQENAGTSISRHTKSLQRDTNTAVCALSRAVLTRLSRSTVMTATGAASESASDTSAPPGKRQLGHDRFLPNPFQLIIHLPSNHPTPQITHEKRVQRESSLHTRQVLLDGFRSPLSVYSRRANSFTMAIPGAGRTPQSCPG